MKIRSESKRAIGAIALLLIVAFGLFAFMELYTPFLRSDIPNLKERGETIVEQIESFKVTGGKYPDSISDINMPARSFRFGAWFYHPTNNTYRIGIGDYSKNGFTLSYTPDGGWHLDQ